MTHDDVAVVRGWFEAFNARDLEAMLAAMDPDVEFQPVRVARREYRGHEGVRRWFDDLAEVHARHVIDVREMRSIGAGRVLSAGQIGDGEAPFSSIHEVAGGRIVLAHHYLSDASMLADIGLVPKE